MEAHVTSNPNQTERKRILVILGHPNKESFNGALAQAYIQGASQAGAEVRRLDLGDLEFDPVVANPKRPTAAASSPGILRPIRRCVPSCQMERQDVHIQGSGYNVRSDGRSRRSSTIGGTLEKRGSSVASPFSLFQPF